MDRHDCLLKQQQPQHGVLRLPPGFRFHPTDEELVVQYLRRKVLCCPLPAVGIPEINLRSCDPWDLPGGCEGERYFFSLREAKYPHGSRSNRTTSSGYWKATGKDRTVVSSRSSQMVVVGTKKVLVFHHRGKPPAGSRTDWIMHEYRLAGAAFPQRKDSSDDNQMVAGRDWVLCRIFKRKRASNTGAELEEQAAPSRSRAAVDFAGRRGAASRGPSASSETSCVTDASEDGSSSGDEATSTCMR